MTHQHTIGGSEAYELLERPQYGKGCRRALAYRKLGYEPDYPIADDDPILAIMAGGNRLESVAADLFSERTGWKTRRVPPNRIHPRFPWARVSTDRLIQAPLRPPGDLELKAMGEGPFRRVERLGPLPGASLQIQWSLWVTGHSWGALGILGVFSSLPFIWIAVEPDEELHAIFWREAREFANQVFIRGELPEPTFAATDQRCKICQYRMTCRGEQYDITEAEELRQIQRSSKELVQITNPDLARTLEEIELLKRENKAIEETLELAREKALEQLGEVDGAVVRGFGRVHRLPVVANYFDSARLRWDDPELWQKYRVHRETGGYYLRTYPNNK